MSGSSVAAMVVGTVFIMIFGLATVSLVDSVNESMPGKNARSSRALFAHSCCVCPHTSVCTTRYVSRSRKPPSCHSKLVSGGGAGGGGGGLGGGGGGAAPGAGAALREEDIAQLQAICSRGRIDVIAALQRTGGNVEAAADVLLSHDR